MCTYSLFITHLWAFHIIDYCNIYSKVYNCLLVPRLGLALPCHALGQPLQCPAGDELIRSSGGNLLDSR